LLSFEGASTFGSGLASTFGASTLGSAFGSAAFSFLGSTDFFSVAPFLTGRIGDTGSGFYFFSSFGFDVSLTGSTFFSYFPPFVGAASPFFFVSGDFETELLATTTTGLLARTTTYLVFLVWVHQDLLFCFVVIFCLMLHTFLLIHFLMGCILLLLHHLL